MSEQRAKNKHRHKKNSVRELPEEDPDFQIAPMIDVLLVLLVFFMSISSTEVLQSVKGIELPIAAQGKDASKNVKQMMVNISWVPGMMSGAITVDEQNYPTPDSLIPEIVKRLKIQPDLRILIRADKQTQYAYVRTVLLAVGKTDVKNITFSVVDKEQPKAQVASQ